MITIAQKRRAHIHMVQMSLMLHADTHLCKAKMGGKDRITLQFYISSLRR